MESLIPQIQTELDLERVQNPVLTTTKDTLDTEIDNLINRLDKLKNYNKMANVLKNIYEAGFINGTFSDIRVQIGGTVTFNLHRIILLQNEYFAAMLNGPNWREKDMDVIEIKLEDANITIDGIRAVLGRLYGHFDFELTPTNARSVLAAASFLGDSGLVDTTTNYIMNNLGPDTVLDYLLFADENYYGPYSDQIVDACFTYLCKEGFENLRNVFVDLPLAWFEKVVTSDCFFVPDEFERYKFLREVIAVRRERSFVAMFPKAEDDQVVRGVSDGDDDADMMEAIFDETVRVGLFGAEKHSTLSSSSSSSTLFNNENDDSGDSAFGSSSSLCADAVAVPTTTKTAKSTVTHNDGMVEDENENEIEEEKDEDLELTTYLRIFSTAVIYAHMSLDELFQVSKDESRSDSKLLITVPPKILHHSFWQQAQLRCAIEDASEDTVSLGLDSYPDGVVPNTDTDKIDGKRLCDVNNQTALTLFKSIDDKTGCKFPPFRFSIEFKDLAKRLVGNNRYYSRTYSYGGSSWVVYLQRLTIDGVNKLGIYLQRWEPSNEPNSLTGTGNAAMRSSRYVDHRVEVKAWFKMFCFFGNKKSYVLESKPDVFKNTQSWGWRSNKLYKDAFDGTQECKDSIKVCVVMGHV